MKQIRPPDRRLLVCRILLILYGLLMLWLLFFRSGLKPDAYFNFIPFQTVKMYVEMLLDGNPYHAFLAVVNLGGNIVMFVPLGLLLPQLWNAQRLFPVFLLTVTGLIVLIEALQYATRLGIADLDDLILNDLGACLGFLAQRLLRSAVSRHALQSLPRAE